MQYYHYEKYIYYHVKRKTTQQNINIKSVLFLIGPGTQNVLSINKKCCLSINRFVDTVIKYEIHVLGNVNN